MCLGFRSFLVCISLLVLQGTVLAQEPPDSETQEAIALFEAGRTAFDNGRFESAFESIQRAYELSHRPGLLYNMGAAADRLRRDSEAVEHYQRYLDQVPDAPNRQLVQARIDFLRTGDAASGESAEPESAGAAAPSSGTTDRGGDNIAEQWWFWTIIAVVVIGAGVGIGVGVALSDPGTQAPPAGNFGTGGVAMALVRF